MREQGPKWRSRALAFEFWLAMAIVAGSFAFGLWQSIRSIITGD